MNKIRSSILLALVAFGAAFSLPTPAARGQAGDPLPTFGRGILACGTAPVAGTNCIQTLTIGGTPTAGTFTMTFKGRTTAAITWSATNATLVANIDAALEALPTIGVGGVTTAVGTMTAGIGTITITFTANNAKLLVGAMTVASSLTGTAPTLANAITTPGVTADGRSSTIGQLLIDKTAGKLYINTSSTALNPTWTVVGSQS